MIRYQVNLTSFESRRSELSVRLVTGQAVCRSLWCTTEGERCSTQHMPWADGTACEDRKWCYHGECVFKKKLLPINGLWSKWGDYDECSRTCGGGVQKKSRECNNPSPQHGGNYCTGDRVRYRSCNTQECPRPTDFR